MLKQAEVTAVVNEVKLVEHGKGERPAGVRDVVQGDSSVRTGIKSRAELLFQDQTLTRLGANTLFSFNEGTRNLELEHGTMLLQAPKGIGGAKIHTAAVTAAITGTTILLEYSPAPWTRRQPPGVSAFVAAMPPDQCVLELQHPSRKYSAPDLAELTRKAALAKKAGGFVKVMVLEGTLRLFLNNRVGESVLVNAGQLVILNPNATSIPPGVDFDIGRATITSLLANNKYWGGTASDLNTALIAKAIENQDKSKEAGDLSPSGLRIIGSGTNVIFGDTTVLAEVDRGQTANPVNNPPTQPGPTRTQSPPANNSPTQTTTTQTASSGGGNIGLPLFTLEGSSSSTTDSPPPTSSAITGDVAVLTKLQGTPDTLSVKPKSGSNFILLSNEGTVDPDGLVPRSASRLVPSYDLALKPGDRPFLSLDYRFLTNEIGQAGSFNDAFQVKVTDGTNSILYTLDRDALQPGGTGNLTSIATAGVGGFGAGTAWLPIALDITPFGSKPTVSFIVFDRGDPVVDSAAALDNVKLTINPTSPSSEALPGKLTLTTDNDVTLGSGPGEYSIPSFTTPTGEVVINSSLTVAPATSTKAGTNLTINSTKTSGPAITINNTGELIALLNATAAGPGGKIQLTSSGGTIHVNGGKITADRGTIEVVNNGAGGIVQLTSAQLAADIVKVRALGDNGALRIGGGMISADTTLKLYADGSNGTVEFVDDVSLNGNSAKTIAGNTVTIDNGKVVTIGGNSAASVFTNNANYSGSGGNNSTSGTFAGKGANTQPLIGKPGF